MKLGDKWQIKGLKYFKEYILYFLILSSALLLPTWVFFFLI